MTSQAQQNEWQRQDREALLAVQLAWLLVVPQRQGPRFYLLGGVSLLSRSAPKLCSLNNSSTN
jgi:hypothetical protein